MSGLHEQLSVVSQYCAGSGAKLNVLKCKLLQLAGSPIEESTSPLPVVKPGETVRYLGLPFGCEDTDSKLVNDLEHKVEQALSRWRFRGRTIEGRKLIVTTMVLSLLWYKALHVVLPNKAIHRWQSLINDFILTRKAPPDRARWHAVRGADATIPASQGGLGLPNIDLFLKRQQLRLFQEFAKVVHVANPNTLPRWAVLPVWYACGQKNPMSTALSDIFYTSETIDAAKQCSPWWAQLWGLWSSIVKKLDRPRITSDERRQQLLQAPIWYSELPTLQLKNNDTCEREPLNAGSGKKAAVFISLCAKLQQHGYRSLQDLLFSHGTLVSEQEFVAIIANMQDIKRSRLLPYLTFRLYFRAQAILGGIQLRSSSGAGTSQATAQLVGIKSAQRFWYFPMLPKYAWTRYLCSTTDIWATRAASLNTQPSFLQQASKELFILRRHMLPTVYDMQLRVLQDVLPVNAKFFFLELRQRDPTRCPIPGCFRVEVLSHCFWSCELAHSVWRNLQPVWSCLVTRSIRWSNFIYGATDILLPYWKDNKSVLSVRFCLRGLFLREIWINRNRAAFKDATSILPASALTVGILRQFAAHLRSLHRRHRSLSLRKADLLAVTKYMVTHSQGLITDVDIGAETINRTTFWSRTR